MSNSQSKFVKQVLLEGREYEIALSATISAALTWIMGYNNVARSDS